MPDPFCYPEPQPETFTRILDGPPSPPEDDPDSPGALDATLECVGSTPLGSHRVMGWLNDHRNEFEAIPEEWD